MYGSLLIFLVAIAIQALAPRGGAEGWDAGEVVHLALYPLAAWAALRFRCRRLMARALHDAAEVDRLRVRFSGLVETYQAAMLAPFALMMYATGYGGLVLAPASAWSEVAGSVLGVLPFVLLLGAVWWEAYPLQGVLFGQEGSRGRFVMAHARMELPILVPWLALVAVSDALRWLAPGAHAALQHNTLLQMLYAPAFLLLTGIFLPVLVKALWGCEPVPPGPLRTELETLCRGLRLRVGQILYWPLLEGRVMTAGIVGLLPRFRYLLLTPALVEALPPEELAGVVAHEAGHVRHRHLWFYLLFFLGYVCLVVVFLRLAEAALAWWGIADPEALRRPRASLYTSAGLTLGLLSLLVVYFRVLFGAVSRAFERQADAFALEAVGHPAPLTSALERISAYSGDIRDLPSWHHGSIGERVRFLAEAARNPAVLARHHRRVRVLVRTFALGVGAAAVLAGALHAGPVDRGLTHFVAESGLAHRLRQNPRDPVPRFLLGSLFQEAGDLAKAEAAYEELLRLSPQHADGLNNLAWLYLTARDPAFHRPERGLALAELAARVRPSAHVLDTLAEARFQTRDPRGALEAIRAALALGSENRAYYLAQERKFLRALEGVP